MTKTKELEPAGVMQKDITIGNYKLTATQLVIKGNPKAEDHVSVGHFIERTVKASGFWRADWLLHLRGRSDWDDDIRQQVLSDVGIDESTMRHDWRVARIDPSIRREDVDVTTHRKVAALPEADQKKWLAEAAEHNLSAVDLGARIKAHRRSTVRVRRENITGVYRVGVVNFDDATLSVAEMKKIPMMARFYESSAMFVVVGPKALVHALDVMAAWGFPHNGVSLVWDMVTSGIEDIVNLRHKLILMGTRDGCAFPIDFNPESQTVAPDSVITDRPKPPDFETTPELYKLIARCWEGPYVDMWPTVARPGWDTYTHQHKPAEEPL